MHAVAQLIEVLSYKPEGRGFDSRRVAEIFHWFSPSCGIMTVGLTQAVTEMNTRVTFWMVKAAGA